MVLGGALTVAALLLARAGARRADKVPADKVTVTYASFDALYAPYFLARDHGYFAKEVILDVELMQAGGGTSTPKALIAASVQFSSSSRLGDHRDPARREAPK